MKLKIKIALFCFLIPWQVILSQDLRNIKIALIACDTVITAYGHEKMFSDSCVQDVERYRRLSEVQSIFVKEQTDIVVQKANDIVRIEGINKELRDSKKRYKMIAIGSVAFNIILLILL